MQDWDLGYRTAHIDHADRRETGAQKFILSVMISLTAITERDVNERGSVLYQYFASRHPQQQTNPQNPHSDSK